MAQKKKILLIHTTLSTFVKTDIEILSEKYEVIKYQYNPIKGAVNNALELLKQFFFLLFNIWKFDTVFIWFADHHSFLPVLFAKILGKKSFIVIGGYDVVRLPNLNYGVFVSKIRGACAVFSMRHCTLNLAVSKFVERKVRWITKKSNVHLVYNCLNIPSKEENQVIKENLIITVGLINSERTFFLKGIDTFLKVAEALPEYKFMVIGISKDLPEKISINRPENVEWIEYLKHNELENFYRKAKIYCQFSRSESFGVSIVEAMSFNCIPIVANVGGMAEVVGSAGITVKMDTGEISSKIKEVCQGKFQPKEDGVIRVNTFFRYNMRKKELLRLIELNS